MARNRVIDNEREWTLEGELKRQRVRDGFKIKGEACGFSIVKPELGRREGDWTYSEWCEYCGEYN